ncbi:hypothetical protein E2C01_024365 [Portunus trituberculatus]|uniref:Uncharacterized protein n=1 Tax=Portunus trituberculatus TaxID=210409 RepID=A0A5B7EC42_PORTR|nr:hypothetical protein [Portunus trituberculatus]
MESPAKVAAPSGEKRRARVASLILSEARHWLREEVGGEQHGRSGLAPEQRPEKMKAGDVCRCISDFSGISSEELTLYKNDIVQKENLAKDNKNS